MDLRKLLKPSKIAIVGASEKENLGGFTTRMMMEFSAGRMETDVYLVNPGRKTIFGKACYRSLAEIPEEIDLVIIATAKETVPELLRQAHNKGAGGAVVYASGYGETGKEADKEAEAELCRLCRELDIALMGPNCAGFINLVDHVPAMGFMTTVKESAGKVGLVSQSGMICTLLLDSGKADFSYVISCGNSRAVEVVDYIDFLVDDPHTEVIASYIEGIAQPKKFLAVLKKAAQRGKPVVLLKIGRSESGSRSAASHTGSLSGSDAAFEAVFEKYGVIRVDDLEDLVSMSNLLATLPALPQGDEVVSINGSGGENGVACDVGEQCGLHYPPFSQDTVEALRTILPDYATIQNPLDTTAMVCYDTDLFAKTAETILGDPNFDLAIVGVTIVQELTDLCVKHMSEGLAQLSREGRLTKPVVVVPAVEAGRMAEYVGMLKEAGIPVLPPCSYACRQVKRLLRYAKWRRETDPDTLEDALPDAPASGAIQALSEHASKELLRSFGVPVPEEQVAKSAQEAVQYAEAMGYPVVLKIESADILHKSDVGGVRLSLQREEEVRKAYEEILENAGRHCPQARINGVLVQKMLEPGLEVIVGVQNDPLLGPMVLCGLGGVFVEVFRDAALFPAPLRREDALRMIRSLKAYKLFQGYRGQPELDVEALAQILVSVGDFAVEYRNQLAEMDINPVFVYPKGKGAAAADGLVVLRSIT